MRQAAAPTPAALPPPHAAAPSVVRGVLVSSLVLGGLAALVVAPPFLPDGPLRHGLLVAFSTLCHQLPDRTFHVHGVPFAMCMRDTGIVFGLVAGALAYPLLASLDRRIGAHAPKVLALAGLPLAVDWALTFFHVWENTPLSRTLTGALFGFAAGVFVTRGFVEMTTPVPLAPSSL